MTNLRKLTAKDVTIEVIAFHEDTEVQGNAMCSGDDMLDAEVENEIIRRLGIGDVWAWCVVEVRVLWNGFTGSDYLGACSYVDESDFVVGGYYDDMLETALEELNSEVRTSHASTSELLVTS